MLDGLLNLSFWGYVVATLIMTHITIVSVTLFLHRHQAHRAVELHPAVSHFFRFWLWLTTGMLTKQWVAVHRKHHAKVETKDDPHSPQQRGILKVLLEGTELYREEASNPETLLKYGHGTPEDWIERNFYGRYKNYGLWILLVIDLILFGIASISMWGIQLLWIPFFAAGVVNGVGHWGGYRNYETQDASRNIFPWGILIGGEELHNNHHAFPSSSRLSSKFWEFDIGWLYIRILECVKLARVKKVAPKPLIIPGKHSVDMETLRAVITYRLYIMADYAKDVILPVLKEELRRADNSFRGVLKHARRLLVREPSLMTAETRKQLENVLKRSQSLQTVYQFKLRLQELWNRSAASHENLLNALQEWCTQAEATGIAALEEFARSLRGYAPRSV
jgi:Fatty-acid desaturase